MAYGERATTAYLVLKPKSHWGLTARITSKPPSLAADEIAIRLEVKVPDALFRRPSIQAQVTIPADKVTPHKLDATVLDNVREVLQQQTGFDVSVSLVEPEQPQ